VKSYESTSFGYKSIQEIQRDGVLICHDKIIPCQHPSDSGSISRDVQGGYATFGGLSSLIAFRSVQLMFRTKSGQSTSSTTFQVPAGSPHQLQIRQQPIFAEAGKGILFEVGVLDAAGFVIEHDFSTMVSMELLENPTGAQIGCPVGLSECTHRRAQAGFVLFNVTLYRAAARYSVRFQFNDLQYVHAGSHVQSEVFAVLHTTPSAMQIISQPYNVQAEEVLGGQGRLPPTSILVDEYWNQVTVLSDLTYLPPSGYLFGCDSIELNRICDVEECASRGQAVNSNGCCELLLNLPMNNLHGCLTHNGTRFHEYRVRLREWSDIEEIDYDVADIYLPHYLQAEPTGHASVYKHIPGLDGTQEYDITIMKEVPFPGLSIGTKSRAGWSFALEFSAVLHSPAENSPTNEIVIFNVSIPFRVLPNDAHRLYIMTDLNSTINAGQKIPFEIFVGDEKKKCSPSRGLANSCILGIRPT
jgi:hypothetical protein